VILRLEGATQLADPAPLAHRLLGGVLSLPVVAEIIRGNGAGALEQTGSYRGHWRGVDRLGHLLTALVTSGESVSERMCCCIQGRSFNGQKCLSYLPQIVVVIVIMPETFQITKLRWRGHGYVSITSTSTTRTTHAAWELAI